MEESDGAAAALHRSLFVDAGIDVRGHRTNLMNPGFREIGPGIAFGSYLGYNAERDKLISKYRDTWIYEGSVFSVYAEGQQPAGTLPVFRFWSNAYGHHF